MSLFRKKFPKKKYNLAFIYVSDDPQWGRQYIMNKKGSKNMFIIGDPLDADGKNDLALLAICNHTIQSYGSYSYFAGFLAGGLRIIPEHFEEYDNLKANILKKDPLENVLPELYFLEGIHVQPSKNNHTWARKKNHLWGGKFQGNDTKNLLAAFGGLNDIQPALSPRSRK